MTGLRFLLGTLPLTQSQRVTPGWSRRLESHPRLTESRPDLFLDWRIRSTANGVVTSPGLFLDTILSLPMLYVEGFAENLLSFLTISIPVHCVLWDHKKLAECVLMVHSPQLFSQPKTIVIANRINWVVLYPMDAFIPAFCDFVYHLDI